MVMVMVMMLADATAKREKREKMSKLCDSMVVAHYGTSIGSPTAIFSFGCELFLLPSLVALLPPPPPLLHELVPSSGWTRFPLFLFREILRKTLDGSTGWTMLCAHHKKFTKVCLECIKGWCNMSLFCALCIVVRVRQHRIESASYFTEEDVTVARLSDTKTSKGRCWVNSLFWACTLSTRLALSFSAFLYFCEYAVDRKDQILKVLAKELR